MQNKEKFIITEETHIYSRDEEGANINHVNDDNK